MLTARDFFLASTLFLLPMAKTKKKPPQLLWQIDKPNLPGTSYLFGTMHVRDIRAFDYQDLVCEKIKTCDTFATEINLKEAELLLGEQSMDLPEGQLLSDFYSPKKYAKIGRFFQKNTGMSIQHFERAKPMMLTNFVTGNLLNNDQPLSLDQFLWEYAEKENRILLGIETVQEQIEIMDKIPLDYQASALWSMVKNVSRFRKNLLKLSTLYQEGNLSKILKSAKKSTGKLRKMMIYDRNELMAERIALLVEEQTLFAAVGAGHLGGKKGMIKKLKAAGFRLKSVPNLPRSSKEFL